MQGYPISEELQEVSDLDGRTCAIQHFERAVFELHPENQPPWDVLLSQLGTFRYKQKYHSGATNQHTSTDHPYVFAQIGKIIVGKFHTYGEIMSGCRSRANHLRRVSRDVGPRRQDLHGAIFRAGGVQVVPGRLAALQCTT